MTFIANTDYIHFEETNWPQVNLFAKIDSRYDIRLDHRISKNPINLYFNSSFS